MSLPSPVSVARWSLAIALLALCSLSCAARPTGPTSPAGAPHGALSDHSNIACRVHEDCAVCFPGGSCGEAIAASDPALATAACHVTPPALCMPRRGRCDHERCVAR
jgi:hypothetical protein